MEEDLILIRRGTLRAVLDVAASSDDFCSGHLDDEEVSALRAAARVLGSDPDLVTPARFLCRYRRRHSIRVELSYPMFDGPDGVVRNAYRPAYDYPADVRDKLRRDGMLTYLGLLRAPAIQTRCLDCGRTFEPFADTSWRE